MAISNIIKFLPVLKSPFLNCFVKYFFTVGSIKSKALLISSSIKKRFMTGVYKSSKTLCIILPKYLPLQSLQFLQTLLYSKPFHNKSQSDFLYNWLMMKAKILLQRLVLIDPLLPLFF